MKGKMTIKYQEHDADSVMQYFTEGFKMKPGLSLANYEWFYDPAKRKIVFKLYIEGLQEA